MDRTLIRWRGKGNKGMPNSLRQILQNNEKYEVSPTSFTSSAKFSLQNLGRECLWKWRCVGKMTGEINPLPLPPSLTRTLGLVDGVCILISIIIGSGIFSSPGETLSRSGSPGAALVSWCISGVLVIIASFCYAELGSMMPSTGGDFDYLYKAYGDYAAFSFTWFFFWISKPGSQAIVATVFGNYLVKLFTGLGGSDGDETISKALSVTLLVSLVFLNCLGVKSSKLIANILTGLKISLILLLLISGIIFVSRKQHTITDNLSIHNSFDGTNLLGMGSSMIPCLWAYDGWSSLNFLAEEMRDFEKNLPRAILGAVLTVMTCYITANLAYISVLSQDQIEDSDAIAIDFGREVQSKGQSILAGCFALGVALSVAGTCHGSLMTGARAFYATAREGMAPPFLAELNRWNAPYVAVIAQGAWAIVLVLLPGSSFSTMLDYSGPASWLFYAITGSSIIWLRITEPDAARPFKVPFYPLPPLLLCAMSLFLIISSIVRSPLFCILALILVAISLPVWYIAKKYYGLHFPSLPPLPTESTTQPLLSEFS